MTTPRNRFKTRHATPPGGWYEYAAGGTAVRAKTIRQICEQATQLRRSKGLPVVGDGFDYVMEYMCPSLPNGFCTQRSNVVELRAEEVKRRTEPLFRLPVATSDVVEARLIVCSKCPSNVTQGYCPECSGLLDWVYRGFGGRRGPLPPDRAVGVCLPDRVMAAAGATPASRPPEDGAEYPAGCWRAGNPETSEEAPDGTAG